MARVAVRVDEPVPDDSFNPSQYNVIDSAI